MAATGETIRTESLRDMASRRRVSWHAVRTIAIVGRIRVCKSGKTVQVRGIELSRLEKLIDEYQELEKEYRYQVRNPS